MRLRLRSRCGKVLARNSIWSLRAASDGDPTRPSLAMSNPIVIQLNVSRSRSSGARSRCPAGHLRFQSRGSTTFEPRGAKSTAFLHYDSCWHTGGIKTKTGGIDPTLSRPNPRPTTPCSLFATIPKGKLSYKEIREESYNVKVL